jgi:hypothetical protein
MGPVIGLLINLAVEIYFIAREIDRKKKDAAAALTTPQGDDAAQGKTREQRKRFALLMSEKAEAMLEEKTLCILDIDIPKSSKWRDGEHPPREERTIYDYIDYYIFTGWPKYYEKFQDNGFGKDIDSDKKDVIALEKKILQLIANTYPHATYLWGKKEFDVAPLNFKKNPMIPRPPEGWTYSDGSGMSGRDQNEFLKSIPNQPYEYRQYTWLSQMYKADNGIDMESGEKRCPSSMREVNLLKTPFPQAPIIIQRKWEEGKQVKGSVKIQGKEVLYTGEFKWITPGETWEKYEKGKEFWEGIYNIRGAINQMILDEINKHEWGYEHGALGKGHHLEEFIDATIIDKIAKPRNISADDFWKKKVARDIRDLLGKLAAEQNEATGKNWQYATDELWKRSPYYKDYPYGIPYGIYAPREVEAAYSAITNEASKKVAEINKGEITRAADFIASFHMDLDNPSPSHKFILKKPFHHTFVLESPGAPPQAGDVEKPKPEPKVKEDEAKPGEEPRPIQDPIVKRQNKAASAFQVKEQPVSDKQKRLNTITEHFRNKISGSGIEMSAQEQADAERLDPNHDALDTFPEDTEDIEPEADDKDESEVAAQTKALDPTVKKSLKQQVSNQIKVPPLSQKQKRINAIAARFQEKK